jgi:hypothetical protein
MLRFDQEAYKSSNSIVFSTIQGGMSLSNMIKIAQQIDFGTLYIKPAFVFIDGDGHAKLQFEMDPNSALGYVYDALSKQLGIAWNYDEPYNQYNLYTNCAMHAAGDRASYGCGPEGTNSGGFCPQMTLAYKPKFNSAESALYYLQRSNNYVDYWRSLYPSGVAVGTSSFCKDGGCLGLFLNRLDLYEVFKPALGGSWVEYNGASMAPTISPAPTWIGGCDDPHNSILDKCIRERFQPPPSAIMWAALGWVGQLSIMLVMFMAVTLSVSIFLARARKKRRRGESYLGFFFRDLTRKKRRRRKGGLDDGLLKEGESRRSRSSGRRSTRSSSRSKKGKSVTGSTRSRSNSRSIRSVSVQPQQADAQSRRSASGTSRDRRIRPREASGEPAGRSGVFDMTLSSPQPNEPQDNRQQLV